MMQVKISKILMNRRWCTTNTVHCLVWQRISVTCCFLPFLVWYSKDTQKFPKMWLINVLIYKRRNWGNHDIINMDIITWMQHAHERTICAHAYIQHLCTCLLMCVVACMLMLHDHVYMHACSLPINCFFTLKLIHYFIVALSTKQDISKQQKISNITTEQKDLKQLTDIRRL